MVLWRVILFCWPKVQPLSYPGTNPHPPTNQFISRRPHYLADSRISVDYRIRCERRRHFGPWMNLALLLTRLPCACPVVSSLHPIRYHGRVFLSVIRCFFAPSVRANTLRVGGWGDLCRTFLCSFILYPITVVTTISTAIVAALPSTIPSLHNPRSTTLCDVSG